MSYDLALNLFINRYLSNPFFDAIFIVLTKLGDYGILWILTGFICLFFKKTRFVGLCVLTSFILSLTVSTIIKHMVGRLRPFQDYGMKLLIKAPGGSSFPSSHAAGSFGAASAFFLTAKEKPASYYRWPVLILALLTAFSRLYLFVHYPSDVLAGITVGVVVGFLTVYILRKLKDSEKLKE